MLIKTELSIHVLIINSYNIGLVFNPIIFGFNPSEQSAGDYNKVTVEIKTLLEAYQ